MSPAIQIRYVALGDSTGVGVGAREGGGYVERLFQRLRRERPGVGLLNLCVSGATSATVLSGQLERAVRARPQLVTLGIGVNDLWRGVSATEYERNLERIVSALSGTGTAGVMVNLPDLALAPVAGMAPAGLLEGRFEPYNAAVSRVAARYHFTYVDLFEFSRRDIPKNPNFFSADGFHPSEHGYAHWADLMWPSVLASARFIAP